MGAIAAFVGRFLSIIIQKPNGGPVPELVEGSRRWGGSSRKVLSVT
jgi:hypothetical protein